MSVSFSFKALREFLNHPFIPIIPMVDKIRSTFWITTNVIQCVALVGSGHHLGPTNQASGHLRTIQRSWDTLMLGRPNPLDIDPGIAQATGLSQHLPTCFCCATSTVFRMLCYDKLQSSWRPESRISCNEIQWFTSSNLVHTCTLWWTNIAIENGHL